MIEYDITLNAEQQQVLIYWCAFFVCLLPFYIEWLLSSSKRVSEAQGLNIKVTKSYSTHKEEVMNSYKGVEVAKVEWVDGKQTDWSNEHININVTDNNYNEGDESDPDFLQY